MIFYPTCNEPAEIVEVQEGHAARGYSKDQRVLKHGSCVGQQQSKKDGHSHHYQVHGNVGLYWTLVQMFRPLASEKNRHRAKQNVNIDNDYRYKE